MLTTSSSVSSAVGAVPISLPSRRTVMRSHTSKISESRCEMKMIDTPSSRSERIRSNSTSVSRSVSDEVGSSIAMRSALSESALATSAICCSAMLRKRTSVRASMSRPNWSRSACARPYSSRQSMKPGRNPRGSRPRKMFCPTVR